MALTIELAPEVEQAIIAEAAAKGTTPELLVAEGISTLFLASEPAPKPLYPPGSLAEHLADYIGAVHSSEHTSGGAQMSVDCGRKFAEGMVKTRAVGRL